MIYKRCPRCHKRIPTGTACPDCKREYAPPEGVYKLYHTKRWRSVRDYIMARHNGLDAWALHYYNRIEYAETVHHIIPSSEDAGLFFSTANLIPMSRSSHDEIHALYKKDKAGTQAELKKIVAAGGTPRGES